MQVLEPLTAGNFYHVLSHGTGRRDLFPQQDNYSYFLQRCDKYLKEVVEVYAWVLMPNHFQMLLKVVVDDFSTSSPDGVATPAFIFSNPDGVSTPSGLEKIKVPPSTPYHLLSKREKLSAGQQGGASHQLSKLFNAYAQALNKRERTWGGLFERPFRRKLVDSERYMRQLVLYIHLNPVHHGFCSHPAEYPWSSYLAGGTQTLGMTRRPVKISWFGDEENYLHLHGQRAMELLPGAWTLEQ